MPPPYSARQEPTQPQTITLTLDQAIEIALNENPTIRIADMEIERQDYVRKETVGNLLPSLSGSGQYSYAIIKQKMSKSGLSFGADNTVTVAANLNVPLFVPSVYASLKLNDAQIAEAVESARSSRVNMVNEVRKAYYNMLLLQESLDVLRESEKIMQETVDNTRMMYEAELGSEYDYITAQSNLSAIMPNIIQTEGSIEVADLYMHMLLSLPNDVEITFVGDLDYYSEDIVNSTGYYSTDVSNNSDLKLLDIQERMLEAQLKMTNAQRIPTVSAFGSLSLYGNDMPEINFGDLGGGSQVAGSSKQFWWQYPASVGVSISIPIFSGNKINNQAKQAKIAIDQLKMQREYMEESTRHAGAYRHQQSRYGTQQDEGERDGHGPGPEGVRHHECTLYRRCGYHPRTELFATAIDAGAAQLYAGHLRLSRGRSRLREDNRFGLCARNGENRQRVRCGLF